VEVGNQVTQPSNTLDRQNLPNKEIDCSNAGWKPFLKNSLQEGRDVDLGNFDYTVDGQFCELLALSSGMVFSLDVNRKAGFFRKKAALLGGLPRE
jgi:hypothetical protein